MTGESRSYELGILKNRNFSDKNLLVGFNHLLEYLYGFQFLNRQKLEAV